MILETTGDGPLGIAVRGAIEGTGEGVKSALWTDDSLFEKALGCRAIVHAMMPSLLDGKLAPAPSPDRMRAVLRASRAPGVELVVIVAPLGVAYDEELLVLKKDGKPYVIVRCAPLLEEIAEAADFATTRRLWLARGATTPIATAFHASAEILRALRDDSLQGRTIELAEPVDVADAIARAAQIAGAPADVQPTSRAIGTMYRKISSWLGRADPPALALYDRMLASGGMAA